MGKQALRLLAHPDLRHDAPRRHSPNESLHDPLNGGSGVPARASKSVS